MLNVITFCVNSINYNILRRNRHGKAERRPNLKAFRTRFCLTPFIWNSAFITGSSLCLKISLKTFNNYSPVTLAHEQRFNHMSLNSKIKTYRLFNFSHQQLGLPVSLPDYLYRFNHMSLNSKIKTYRLFNFPHQQLGLPVSLPDYLYRFNHYAFKFKNQNQN